MSDMAEAEDEVVSYVSLPILWGGSATLYADGRVTLTTCEGDSDLDATDVDALAALLQRAQAMRGRP